MLGSGIYWADRSDYIWTIDWVLHFLVADVLLSRVPLTLFIVHKV